MQASKFPSYVSVISDGLLCHTVGKRVPGESGSRTKKGDIMSKKHFYKHNCILKLMDCSL
uniref:Uncharacterized protein n=1 Tax=Setaria italica TaxID=4555 RepID=K3YBJ4_SETIT